MNGQTEFFIELIVFLIIVNAFLAILAAVSVKNAFRYFSLKGRIVSDYLNQKTIPDGDRIRYQNSDFPLLNELYLFMIHLEGRDPSRDPILKARHERAFPG